MAVDFTQIEVFEGKTLDSLLRQIHDNSESKSKKIDALVNQLATFIKDPNDAVLLVPLLAEYLDVSVKNDDQLIKLANLVQRFTKTADTGESEGGLLTEHEKQQLLNNAKEISQGKIVQMGNG